MVGGSDVVDDECAIWGGWLVEVMLLMMNVLMKSE